MKKKMKKIYNPKQNHKAYIATGSGNLFILISNGLLFVRLWTFLWYDTESTAFCPRWLDVGAARLTSAPCWVIYLQVLQETVWPGGTLPAHPRPERSAAQKEETKERCLDCLMQLLPGTKHLPESEMELLGCARLLMVFSLCVCGQSWLLTCWAARSTGWAWRPCWRLCRTIRQTSGQQYWATVRICVSLFFSSCLGLTLCRHLIYCVCDLLLEFLIPESCDEAFQTSLLQSLAKDTERDSPHAWSTHEMYPQVETVGAQWTV